MNCFSVVPLACVLSATTSAQSAFGFSRSALPPIPEGYDLCAGDVDGDGDVDLVVSNDHSPNQLLLNDGTGAFVDATAGRLVTPSGGFPSNASYEGDLADLDGDDDLDLVFCNDHDLANRVYLNDGLGFFTDVTATALPNHLEWSVDQVLGDFDGDGDVDWYVSNFGTSRLYLNDGHGVFQDATATNLPAGSGGEVRRGFAVDLELDGDLDIVLPRNSAAQVLVNQGGAVFTLDRSLLPYSGLIHAADVDGNGLVDLVAFNGTRLLRNLGGLVFDTPVLLPAFTVTSLDIEGDGDVDLLGSSGLLLNDGLGAFTLAPGLPAGHPAPLFDSVCVADLDGDRDLDVVDAYSDNRPSAWFNLRTQLLAPLAPVVGQPYRIDLYGGSVAEPVQFFVAVSLASRVQQLPFGTLRLDLRAGRLLAPVLANGSPASLTARVPQRLSGHDVYLQALGSHPTRGLFLTNAVHEVVP